MILKLKYNDLDLELILFLSLLGGGTGKGDTKHLQNSTRQLPMTDRVGFRCLNCTGDSRAMPNLKGLRHGELKKDNPRLRPSIWKMYDDEDFSN